MRQGLGLGALVLMLAGCGVSGPLQPTVIDSRAISTLQDELRRQIGDYNQTIAYYHANRAADPAHQAGTIYACGSGNVDFEIVSAKIDMMTSSEALDKANASASLPVTPVIVVTPTAAVSRDTTNLQELVYQVWPAGPDFTHPPATPPDLTKSQIAQAILDLRNGLVASAGAKPGQQPQCFLDYNPSSPQDAPHSYKLGVTAAYDAQGGFSLKIGIANLGAGLEQKSTGQNAILVTFRQSLPAASASPPDPSAPTEAASPIPSCDHLPDGWICVGGKPFDKGAPGIMLAPVGCAQNPAFCNLFPGPKNGPKKAAKPAPPMDQ